MKIFAALTAFFCIVTGTVISGGNNTFEIKVRSNENLTAVCETEAAVTEVSETTALHETVASVSEDSQTSSAEEIKETENVKEDEIIREAAVTEEKNPEAEVKVQGTETESVSAESEENTVTETEEPEPEYSEEQVVYKELLEKLRFETEGIDEVTYYLHDMNHDDTAELITITGTCEADKTLTFYTIKDHKPVVIGENFRGDHASVQIDRNTDEIVIYNEWGGYGSVTAYRFDDTEVREGRAIKDYCYMGNEEGYRALISEMFDTWNNGYGLAYSNGESYLVAIDYDYIRLGDHSYFFTD